MRFYPALPAQRVRTVLRDLAVLLLLFLFAWLGLKVHNAVDQLAVLGTGVERVAPPACQEAGATILAEPADQGYCDRRYDAEEGHPWSFAQHVRDQAPEDWGATVA